MDNAQKAIMIGVGLFITIIIIAAVMLITGMGQDLMNTGTQQLSQMSAQLEKQLTQDFDGTTKTGGQVLAAVKKYHGDSSMVIIVDNKAGTGTDGKTTLNDDSSQAGGLILSAKPSMGDDNSFDAGSATLSENTTITHLANFSDRTNSAYIVTTAKYKAYLIKSNGGVCGIAFKKQ